MVISKGQAKVKNQVEDIADDLIKLYSERSQLKGFAFSADDDEQHAFDDAFLMLKQMINFAVLRKSREICRILTPWIDFWLEMLVLGRLSSNASLLLRQSMITNRWSF